MACPASTPTVSPHSPERRLSRLKHGRSGPEHRLHPLPCRVYACRFVLEAIEADQSAGPLFL
jgi:hypothetical protein